MRPPHRARTLLLALTLALGGCAIVGPSRPGATIDYSPLFEAVSRGDVATVRTSLEAQPALVRRAEWRGDTLLHDAVGKRQYTMVGMLLDHGAKVNSRNDNGFTPLHVAAQNGDLEMIRLLLGRGSALDAHDKRDRTPLDVAIAWRHDDAAALLRSVADGAARPR